MDVCEHCKQVFSKADAVYGVPNDIFFDGWGCVSDEELKDRYCPNCYGCEFMCDECFQVYEIATDAARCSYCNSTVLCKDCAKDMCWSCDFFKSRVYDWL